MAKNLRRPKSRSDDDVRDRVIHLLDTIWHGNRADMAREVGFSHTAINNVVNGNRAPGRRLLQAIAEHPKVNPAWLLQGQGAPLLAARADAPAGDWMVPISKVLLPGPPKECHTLLTDQQWPVCASDYRPTRYFLEVQHDQPILQRDRERFAADDLLLFETDATAHSRIDSITGAVCVVRFGDDADAQLRLARVRPHCDEQGGQVPGCFEADAFDRGLNQSDLGTRVILEFDQHGELKVNRSMSLRTPPDAQQPRSKKQPKSVRVGALAISPPPQVVSSNRIVAVCVLCARRYP